MVLLYFSVPLYDTSKKKVGSLNNCSINRLKWIVNNLFNHIYNLFPFID